VRSLLEAQGIPSTIAQRIAQTRNTNAEAGLREAQLPSAVGQAEADLALAQGRARESGANVADLEQRTKERISSENIRLRTLNAELDNAVANGQLTSARAKQIRDLGPIQLAQAELEFKREQERNNVEVQLPAGGSAVVKPEVAVTAASAQARLAEDQRRFNINQKNVQARLQNSENKDATARRNDAIEAERYLIAGNEGVNDNTPKSVAPFVDQFNASSDGTEVWINHNNKNIKFSIPQGKNTRITARMLYLGAQAKQMSVKDFMAKFIYANIPITDPKTGEVKGATPPWLQ